MDADLWQRVQARLAAAGATFLRRMDGRLIGRPSGADVESPYLLSGIAVCGHCGGSLVAMTRSHGRQRVPFYGCLRYHKRGATVSGNGLQIRQDVLDGAVLDVLAMALDPDVLTDAIEATAAEMRASQAEVAARLAVIEQELDAIAARERRLLDALVDGDMTAGPIRERLRAEPGRRDVLTAERAALRVAAPVDTATLVQAVTARAADLRSLLGRHVAQARQVVRLMLEGRLTCQPFEDGATKGYTFTATETYRRLGVPTLEACNAGRGPNGTRANLHNSSARFHCTLRFGSRFEKCDHTEPDLREANTNLHRQPEVSTITRPSIVGKVGCRSSTPYYREVEVFRLAEEFEPPAAPSASPFGLPAPPPPTARMDLGPL